MKVLFEQTKINQMKLKNRFVRSATWEGLANSDGSCSEEISSMMVELARGQLGLIITGHAFVHPRGQAGIRQLGIYHDDLINGYKKMIDQVHLEESKIVLQINHAGGRALVHSKAVKPIGPSSLEVQGYSCREMTEKEIGSTIQDFTDAAVRAKKAGFDGVQIHAAHGFLLSQFLSPYFNRREDAYGGNVQNRARIILQILRSIRSKTGRQFTIIIKLNSDDYIEGGFTPDDMVVVALLLEKGGIDAIEISGGTFLGVSKYSSSRVVKSGEQEEEVYYHDAARLFKQKLSVPLILVGGIRSFEIARELVKQEETDYVSLCRPLIREPGLIKRWQAGDIQKATCISCNKCFVPTRAGEGLYCIFNQ